MKPAPVEASAVVAHLLGGMCYFMFYFVTVAIIINLARNIAFKAALGSFVAVLDIPEIKYPLQGLSQAGSHN